MMMDLNALADLLRTSKGGKDNGNVLDAASNWGYNTGGLFGTTAPNAANGNSRFVVAPMGTGYGIWDMNGGGFHSHVFDTEKGANNFAAWQNYINSKMPRY